MHCNHRFTLSVSRLAVGLCLFVLANGLPILQAAQLQYDANGTGPAITDGNTSSWNTTFPTNQPWFNSVGGTYSVWNNANNDVAVFGGGTEGTAAAVAVGNVVAGGIIFNAPFAGAYALSSGTITLAGATPTITVNYSSPTSIPNIRSQLTATSFLKNGIGTLVIDNANNSLGAITIDEGKLDIFQRLTSTSVVVNGSAGFLTHSGNVWTMDSLTYNSTVDSGFYSGNTNSTFTIGTGGLTLNGTGRLNISTDAAAVISKVILKGDLTANETTSILSGGAAAGLPANRQLDFDGAVRTVTVANTKTLTVGVVIQNGGLIKEGTGTLVLQGINTYASDTVINAGTLRLSSTAVMGASTNNLTVATGATLDLNASSQTQETISGGGTITNTSGSVTSTLSVGANHTDSTFDGVITASSTNRMAVVKNGNGRLLFTNANTYAGGTTLNGGTLAALDTTIYGSSGQVKRAFGSGALNISSGTVEIRANGLGTTAAETLNYGNAVTLTGNATFDINRASGTATTKSIRFASLSMGAQTLTVRGGNNYTLDFPTGTLTGNATFDVQTGVILNINTLAGGTNSITKNGAGRLIIRGGTHGDFTVNAGVGDIYGTTTSGNVTYLNSSVMETHSGNNWSMNSLTYSTTNSGGFSAFSQSSTYTIGAGGLNITSNANLNISAQGELISSTLILKGDVTVSGNATLTRNFAVDYLGTMAVDLDGGNRTFDVAASRTFNLTVVTRNGGLTKAGTGIMNLGQANTYAGNTIISAGTLRLTSAGSIDSSARISVNSGATYDVASVTAYSVKSGQTLEGGGSVTGAVTINSGAFLAPGTTGGDLTQTLTLSAGLTLTTGSTTTLQLSNVVSDYDRIVAGGTLTQQTGARIVVEPNGFVAAYGQSYNLFDWVGVGSFSSNIGALNRDGSDDDLTDLDLPSLVGTGFTWDVSQFATSGVVMIIPEPSRVVLLMLAGLAILGRRRRSRL